METKETDTYYLNIKEPNKSSMLALRDIILNQDNAIVEFLKFKTPCFRYNGRVLCYLWIDKETGHPSILMQDGKYLNHPDLEETSHKQIGMIRVYPLEDLPIKTIESILNAGIKFLK